MTPDALQVLDVLDAAIRRLADAEAALQGVQAAADRIVADTAWQSAAVAAYHRMVADWQARLRQAAAQVGRDQQRLRTLRASLLAQAGTG
ncbi:hypothetical protein GCM10022240_03370 [Microbacterium kribbense]|uniref:WXG100 family type VII secretion target n=1 Tax=Microbacterium kribbense TaxID=433645 RepID=A0ABP7G2K1_9MICO